MANDQSITPGLAVHDAATAISFYEAAFGAEEVGERLEWEGKIGHAAMRVGSSTFHLADEFPPYNVTPNRLGGSPVRLTLAVDDVDAALFRAKEAGAEVVREPSDQPYGRVCTLRDPFGHVWMLHGSVPS